MRPPVVVAWVEERNLGSCLGIGCKSCIELARIAVVASTGEVCQSSGSPCGNRLDMIDRERVQREDLRALTVLTPLLGTCANLATQGSRDVGTRHPALRGRDGTNPELVHELTHGHPPKPGKCPKVFQALGSMLLACLDKFQQAFLL